MIRFQNWLFSLLCGFTPDTVARLASFYEKTTGRDPHEITDEEC